MKYSDNSKWIALCVVAILGACSDDLNLPTPTLDRVTPASGALGETPTLSIEGSGFLLAIESSLGDKEVVPDDITVTLGGNALGNVVLVSDSVIQATVPLGLGAAAHEMVVRFPDGREATLPAAYSILGNKLFFQSAEQSITAGECSEAVTVALQDSAEGSVVATADTPVAITGGASTLRTFSDSLCQTETSSVSISAGSSSADFYFSDTIVGSPGIDVSSPALDPASQTQQVVAAAPASIAFETAAPSVSSCGCSAAITVQALDAFGNVASVSANESLALVSDSGTTQFYSDAACSLGISASQINAGASSATFYIADTTPGVANFAITSANLSTAGQAATILDMRLSWFDDEDGDGFGNAAVTLAACVAPVGFVADNTDCDDNPAACGAGCFPGNSAADICDGRDQNCDTVLDENPEIVWFEDVDGDTFGDLNSTTNACLRPNGFVDNNTDCDDNPGACGAGCFPGNAAADVCDSRNQDCDESVDENPEIVWFEDADGDSFGGGATTNACTQPVGFVDNSNDCDDNPTLCGASCFPGNTAPDGCDGNNQDCDASVDEDPGSTVWFEDADGDGFGNVASTLGVCDQPVGYVADNTDCDDNPAACGAGCFPGNGAADICDSQNQDCDSDVDENPEIVWFADADGDTFGDQNSTTNACLQPIGFVDNSTDCDDLPAPDGCGAGCFPSNAAADICDGDNQDCDASVDENPEIEWFADDDGDTFGNPDATAFACTQPVGFVTDNTDCEDNPLGCGDSCFPGNTDPDICDSRNQDCDASVDEDPDTVWFADVDSDFYGDPGNTTLSCTQPVGFIADNTDCDDNPATCGAGCFPFNGAPDVCDGDNQDCDASVDENPEIVWFADDDSDTFGNSGVTQNACTQPVGFVDNSTDCDDNPLACGNSCFPGNLSADICDGDNQDCDASVDEDPDTVWFADTDGDGFGNVASTTNACTQPGGFVASNTDCDDDIANCGAGCFPGNPAADVCDSDNQDCDASVDENPEIEWFADEDGDGFGSAINSTFACTQPVGFLSDNTDCADLATNDPNCNNEAGNLCNPGITEGPLPDGTCSDNRDNDCDTLTDNTEPGCGCSPEGVCDDGNACTQNDLCHDGLCAGANNCPAECTDDCSPGQCGGSGDCCIEQCDASGGTCPTCEGDCSCDFACNNPTNCDATCSPGSVCHLFSQNAGTATAVCNSAICTFESVDDSRAIMDCNGDSWCEFDCTNDDCELQCEDTTASCLMFCPSGSCVNDCSAPVSCGGGITVCNRPCP